MSTVKVGSMFQTGRFKTAVVLLSLGLALLVTQPVQTQAPPADALQFFKNYFITGDYVVGGVGLRGHGVNGLATGNINISGVPPEADVVAAFLYWQVVTTDSEGENSGSLNVTFKGHPLKSQSPDGTFEPFGKALGTGTPPCWSSGGSTGSSGGNKVTYSYRADVLRYFDVGGDGKLAVNGPHQVQVPDSGSNGNGLPLALGASLVVVYRTSDLPLNAIVLYDGNYSLNNASPTMFQAIRGFYQPSPTATVKMTHIVGSGQANKSETLLFNGAAIPGGSDPFSSSAGDSWDNPTFLGLGLGTAADTLTQFTTEVNPCSDCLTWSAIVVKTPVKDTDGDGLLDAWESETPPSDPYGQPLPNLYAMGARPDHKDLFIEVGYMTTDGVDLAYGGELKPAHSHLPTHAALKLMGDAFRDAPVSNLDGSTGINVHFDVGNAYPAGDLTDPAKNADAYIIRGEGLARGGEAINETDTVCTPDPDHPWVCQFSEYPGTVGWKTGFKFLRDQVLSGDPAPLPGQDDPCDLPGSTCVRRFDRNRKDMFRYVLFAHALGLPKSEEPTDAGFHVPRTNTGVGDFPGGDVMVTLGGFNDNDGLPVGTPFMQASTLMHELGHNMERRHGGEAFEPNCKPTYLSVMNYLYQLRGLLDDAGKPHLDFSNEVYASDSALKETGLFDGFVNPSSKLYRLGWYAPLAGSYLEGRGTVAKNHCDGSPLSASDVPMVRIDARTAKGGIDWNANGTTEVSVAQDINFNGIFEVSPPLNSSDDWSHIRLNQTGARRNTGGLFVDVIAGGVSKLFVGPLSLDAGRGDLGRGDLGRGDLGGEQGRGDLGRGDLGRGDLGRGDLGRGDLGRGDLGRGDLGRGDLGRGDLGRGDLGGGDLFLGNPQDGELDAETAGGLAKTPPNEFTACVIGVNCQGSGTPLHAVSLGWTAPNVGGVLTYDVYRVAGDTLVPGQDWTAVGQPVASAPGSTAYSLVDTSQLSNGASYTYFAVATYADGIKSDPSNLVTITAVNDPPAAGGDSFSTDEDTPLSQAAPGVLANDGDPDSASTLAAVLVGQPVHGSVTLNADGSFTYAPAANYNGPDSFSYKAIVTYGDSGPVVETDVATVTLTVSPVNDPPVAIDDSYTTAEDTPLSLAVLANDTDIDSSTLTAAVVAGPSHGTLSLNTDGSFGYTPAANFNGADSFTYKVSDGALDSAPATVRITVTAVNDAPVAGDDGYTTAEDTPLSQAAPGVLANDADVDSPLKAVLVAGPSHGTLSLNADGSFTYAPAADFFGADAFTYRASDGSLDSATATVRIMVTSVNDAPTISDITDRSINASSSTGAVSFTVGDDDLATVAVSGVSSNAALVPSANIVFGGSGANRTVTVTPAAGKSGTATITVTVTDSGGLTASDTFVLTVNYTFVGLKNVPPSAKINAGSAVSMVWQFTNGSTAVDSSQIPHKVTVTGGGMNLTFLNTDPGGSGFRYSSSGQSWQFNLQTKTASGEKFPVGVYAVTIEPLTAGYPSKTFAIELK
jgi:VCBS repeat-containing protein